MNSRNRLIWVGVFLGMLLGSFRAEAAWVSAGSNQALDVPDKGGQQWVEDSVLISTAPPSAKVANVVVTVFFTHPRPGDLHMDLGRETPVLASDHVWSQVDEAGSSHAVTKVFSTWNGQAVNGAWVFSAVDFIPEQAGVVNSWTLSVEYDTEVSPSAPSAVSPASRVCFWRVMTVDNTHAGASSPSAKRDVTAGGSAPQIRVEPTTLTITGP